jgi:GNAT superfamily N-acetyltransferase
MRITPFSEPPSLDTALAALGWRRFDDTRVMALPELDALRGPAPDAPHLLPISAHAFAHAVGELRGSPVVQREAHAQRLSMAPVPHRAFVVQHGDQTLACGQFAVESDMVGLYDVFVAKAVRGRGLAASLCRALLMLARDEGARRAYLQVEGDNHAARFVYHRLGFADVYAYHYRTLDPKAS